MGERPYREMPLPPGPPRERRLIIDRALVAFNGFAIAALAVSGVLSLIQKPAPHHYQPTLGSVLLEYVFGVHGRAWRRFLAVPSVLLWLGCALFAFAWREPSVGSVSLALLFAAVGILTMGSFSARWPAASFPRS
jgi:hypothetical protein